MSIHGPIVIVVCIEPEAPTTAWFDEENKIRVVFAPEARAREVQAAFDALGYVCRVREVWPEVTGRDRPGPPPRHETARERARRQRREAG
jgi:hypothetical protein